MKPTEEKRHVKVCFILIVKKMENVELQSKVRKFWEYVDEEMNGNFNEDWEDVFFSNDLYYELRGVHHSLSCLVKLCHLVETIEFLVFTTSKEPEVKEAMRALAVCIPDQLRSAWSRWFVIQESNAEELEEDLNKWDGYSRWWDEGFTEEAQIRNLVEQSEFCFIARASLSSTDLSLKEALDKRLAHCSVRLSHMGSTSEPWYTDIDVNYILDNCD